MHEARPFRDQPPAPSWLLRLLDEAYKGPAWHGPTLRGALRGVAWRDAHWRPGPGRHGIRDLVVHAAYWKYVARRRISGEAVGSFARTGSNWFPTPDRPSARSWALDLDLLEREHQQLRSLVAALTPRAMRVTTSRGRVAADEVLGAAFHDVYHAGQIRLIKRLHAAART